jgi:hypothetical protein
MSDTTSIKSLENEMAILKNKEEIVSSIKIIEDNNLDSNYYLLLMVFQNRCFTANLHEFWKVLNNHINLFKDHINSHLINVVQNTCNIFESKINSTNKSEFTRLKGMDKALNNKLNNYKKDIDSKLNSFKESSSNPGIKVSYNLELSDLNEKIDKFRKEEIRTKLSLTGNIEKIEESILKLYNKIGFNTIPNELKK